MRRLALASLVLAPLAALADYGYGEEIPEAASLELTASGFAQLGGLAAGVVPTDFPVPDMHQGRDQCDYYAPWPFDSTCVLWLYRYDFYVTDIDVGVAMDDISVAPATDVLAIHAASTLEAGSQVAPIHIGADVALLDFFGTGGLSFSQECDAWMDPVHVTLDAQAGLAVVTDGLGNRVVDATIPPESVMWGWDLAGSNLNFGGSSCVVSDMEDFFNWLDSVVGVNLFDMLLDLIIPVAENAVNGMIADLTATLEVQLEDLFALARIDQTFAVGDAEVRAALEPSAIAINPDGMRVVMAGSISAPLHPCVADYGYTESPQRAGDLPAIAALGAAPYDLGLALNQDTLDQALFAGWSAGLLCQRVEGSSSVPLTTTMLTLLAPDAFEGILQPDKPVVLEMRPTHPPTSDLGVDHTIDLHVDQLGLDFYAPVEYRLTRVIGSDTDIDVGLDTRFDGATGQLQLDVAFDPATLVLHVNHNEYAPGQSAALEDTIGGLIGSVAGPMIGSLTSGLALGLPSFSGFGFTSLDVGVTGAAGNFLGATGATGEVAYAGSGCSGGCSGTGGAPALLTVVPILALLRRRSRSRSGTPSC